MPPCPQTAMLVSAAHKILRYCRGCRRDDGEAFGRIVNRRFKVRLHGVKAGWERRGMFPATRTRWQFHGMVSGLAFSSRSPQFGSA